MFSKLALFATTASMAIFVAAVPSGVNVISNSCSSGGVQCCNQVFEESSVVSQFLHGLLNAASGPQIGQVGTGCTQNTACSAQTTCCTGNNFSGGVVFGCSPININA